MNDRNSFRFNFLLAYAPDISQTLYNIILPHSQPNCIQKRSESEAICLLCLKTLHLPITAKDESHFESEYHKTNANCENFDSYHDAFIRLENEIGLGQVFFTPATKVEVKCEICKKIVYYDNLIKHLIELNNKHVKHLAAKYKVVTNDFNEDYRLIDQNLLTYDNFLNLIKSCAKTQLFYIRKNVNYYCLFCKNFIPISQIDEHMSIKYFSHIGLFTGDNAIARRFLAYHKFWKSLPLSCQTLYQYFDIYRNCLQCMCCLTKVTMSGQDVARHITDCLKLKNQIEADQEAVSLVSSLTEQSTLTQEQNGKIRTNEINNSTDVCASQSPTSSLSKSQILLSMSKSLKEIDTKQQPGSFDLNKTESVSTAEAPYFESDISSTLIYNRLTENINKYQTDEQEKPQIKLQNHSLQSVHVIKCSGGKVEKGSAVPEQMKNLNKELETEEFSFVAETDHVEARSRSWYKRNGFFEGDSLSEKQPKKSRRWYGKFELRTDRNDSNCDRNSQSQSFLSVLRPINRPTSCSMSTFLKAFTPVHQQLGGLQGYAHPPQALSMPQNFGLPHNLSLSPQYFFQNPNNTMQQQQQQYASLQQYVQGFTGNVHATRNQVQSPQLSPVYLQTPQQPQLHSRMQLQNSSSQHSPLHHQNSPIMPQSPSRSQYLHPQNQAQHSQNVLFPSSHQQLQPLNQLLQPFNQQFQPFNQQIQTPNHQFLPLQFHSQQHFQSPQHLPTQIMQSPYQSPLFQFQGQNLHLQPQHQQLQAQQLPIQQPLLKRPNHQLQQLQSEQLLQLKALQAQQQTQYVYLQTTQKQSAKPSIQSNVPMSETSDLTKALCRLSTKESEAPQTSAFVGDLQSIDSEHSVILEECLETSENVSVITDCTDKAESLDVELHSLGSLQSSLANINITSSQGFFLKH